jgi:hypothetical protein
MSETDRVRVFSNGEAYRTWLHNNCRLCVKRPDCPLEEALASACVLDGTIRSDIAARLGVPADGSEQWWCKERQTETSKLLPPARGMQGGGASMLPGFDDVAAKPADTRYPK